MASAIDVFGSGGGQAVAQSLSRLLGAEVPLLARSRSTRGCARAATTACRSCSTEPDAPAAKELQKVVDALTGKPRGLAGLSLGLSPAARR